MKNFKKKFQLLFIIFFINTFLTFTKCDAQNNVGIGTTTPAPSALLDIDASPANDKGILIPRMNTGQMNAIVSPANGLLIYNTDCNVFDYWNGSAWIPFPFSGIGPPQPSTITGMSPVCLAQNGVVYSVINVSGVTYSWTYSGTGFTCSSGCTSNTITAAFSASATSGILTVTPSSACAVGTPQTFNITVNGLPTAANAGADINPACSVSNTTLAGNPPIIGTGSWSVVSGTASITTPGSPSSGVTGLAVPGIATLRWTISNAPCTSSTDDVVITTTSCGSTCGLQTFASANLNVGVMVTSDGSHTAQQQTNNGVVEKYCYNNVTANCAIYGGFYEWPEAMSYSASINCDPCGSSGVQGICPSGLHIPTDLEFSRYEYCLENTIAPTGNTTLSDFQTLTSWRGTNSTAGPGAKMKVTNSNSPAWDGTNASGFSALPGGFRTSSNGAFSTMGLYSLFWSASENSGIDAWARRQTTGSGQSDRGLGTKTGGFQVRCLYD